MEIIRRIKLMWNVLWYGEPTPSKRLETNNLNEQKMSPQVPHNPDINKKNKKTDMMSNPSFSFALTYLSFITVIAINMLCIINTIDPVSIDHLSIKLLIIIVAPSFIVAVIVNLISNCSSDPETTFTKFVLATGLFFPIFGAGYARAAAVLPVDSMTVLIVVMATSAFLSVLTVVVLTFFWIWLTNIFLRWNKRDNRDIKALFEHIKRIIKLVKIDRFILIMSIFLLIGIVTMLFMLV